MGNGKRPETDRLMLSPAGWREAPFMVRLLGTEKVRRHLGGVVPLWRRPAVIRSYLALGPQEYLWAVRIKTGATLVGLVWITLHKDGRDFELSYQFRPEAWGRGYALEATTAALRLFRQDGGPRRIIAETQVANAASCRLLERLGMSELQRRQRFGEEQVIYATDL